MKFALTLVFAGLVVEPASAHCYSVWRYPWPQRCSAKFGQIRTNAPRPDHSWRVEITKPPDLPAPELTDDGRGAAIAKAKILLGKPQ